MDAINKANFASILNEPFVKFWFEPEIEDKLNAPERGNSNSCAFTHPLYKDLGWQTLKQRREAKGTQWELQWQFYLLKHKLIRLINSYGESIAFAVG